MTTIFQVFREFVQAGQSGVLINRVSRSDKEFHFQNWVRDRLSNTNLHFEEAGRNTYPDFRMVHHSDGYEVKGLAYPGRWKNYDSNSQVPRGFHNGRTIYYVFGRYPKKPDGNSYPLVDLVVCHGDLLNAEHEYQHKNKSIRGFGSYGDILIRDRKMYVAPTPFGLLEGVAHRQTLILPVELDVPEGFEEVGLFVRREVDKLVVKYEFDLRSNELTTQFVPNPNAGLKHSFRALRIIGSPRDNVLLRENISEIDAQVDLTERG